MAPKIRNVPEVIGVSRSCWGQWRSRWCGSSGWYHWFGAFSNDPEVIGAFRSCWGQWRSRWCGFSGWYHWFGTFQMILEDLRLSIWAMCLIWTVSIIRKVLDGHEWSGTCPQNSPFAHLHIITCYCHECRTWTMQIHCFPTHDCVNTVSFGLPWFP